MPRSENPVKNGVVKIPLKTWFGVGFDGVVCVSPSGNGNPVSKTPFQNTVKNWVFNGVYENPVFKNGVSAKNHETDYGCSWSPKSFLSQTSCLEPKVTLWGKVTVGANSHFHCPKSLEETKVAFGANGHSLSQKHSWCSKPLHFTKSDPGLKRCLPFGVHIHFRRKSYLRNKK